VKVYSLSLPEELVEWVDTVRIKSGQSRSDAIRTMVAIAREQAETRVRGESLLRDCPELVSLAKEYDESFRKFMHERVAPVLSRPRVVPALPVGAAGGDPMLEVYRRARFLRSSRRGRMDVHVDVCVPVREDGHTGADATPRK
jgi:hypothetical protein